MIERYTLPEMGRLWTDDNLFRQILEVEIVAAEVMAELGKIPKEAALKIRANADFSMERVHEIESRTHHDILAFLEAVSESLGDESKYVHLGLTSSDVKDTAQAMVLRQAGTLLMEELDALHQALFHKAIEHKDTLMVGRTHGIHAEPITFGLKVAVWYEECKRQKKRLLAAIDDIAVGQLSGAVGTYANLDPRVEEMVCERLGLQSAPVSTQVIQRDRHANFVCVLGNIAGTIDKIATELRNLQRTDILEVEEAFRRGQKGSSAMPHKKNPISSEQLSGLSRIVRSHAIVAFENMPLWHERDLAHSSAERIILPDSTITLHYMLRQATRVVSNLVVYPQHMRRNLERTHGLVFSQRVMLALVEKGMLREEAYEYVQSNAMHAWKEQCSFVDLLKADERINQHLSSTALDQLCQYENYLVHIDMIFQRLGLVN